MSRGKRYVIDTDVLITAKNLYYAFDICPGFWDCIVIRHKDGRLCSIDRVKGEIAKGNKTEDLVLWVKKDLPGSFFEDVDVESITTRYAEIML